MVEQDRQQTSLPLRLIIAGGGTGGHVLPAVSVVGELRRRRIDCAVLWIGSDDGIERSAAHDLGIEFQSVPTGKFRRYLDARTAVDALRVPVGVGRAWSIVRRFQPSVVFSTGGFVSVPTVAASARVAPILTHEQTTILGLATRLNLRFTDVLALSHEQTAARAGSFRGRITVTGNPVRASLLEGDPDRCRDRFGFHRDLPLLYVTGGAKGASPINARVEAMLPKLLESWQILHQAGPPSANDDAARLRERRLTWPAHLRGRYHVTDFVGDELPDVLAAADLVLSRAGAGTMAELAMLGKPSILIPLPLSGGGEQIVNAEHMRAAGAAVVIAQADASPDRLLAELAILLGDRRRLDTMAAAARSLGKTDAAAALADELLVLAATGHQRRPRLFRPTTETRT
ncbi:MAG: UDP-N-acetylglucosamine--N-acetylmuramyl-(pentapeptide) pyrophosphoryl-undecaprenol N-acetylglucosamine transferase [Thermomicrobiales bacterium]